MDDWLIKNDVFNHQSKINNHQSDKGGQMMTPKGQGMGGGGTGKGQEQSGRGRGMGGGQGRGPGGECVCPNCGQKLPHERGKPCLESKCPDCGTYMTR